MALKKHSQSIKIHFQKMPSNVIQIQLGSEIQTSLNLDGLQMVRILNGTLNPEARPVEIRTKVRIWNSLVFKLLGL